MYVVPAGMPVTVVLAPVPIVVIVPGVLVNVHVPVAGKLLKATLPVAVAQVGCVMVPTVGAEGTEFTVTVAVPVIVFEQVGAV